MKNNNKFNTNHNYWELIKELSFTDFKLKYERSILGYFWSLGKPLAYFMVLYVVFTSVFKLGDSIPHYPIYLLLGVVTFGFWAEATSAAMQSITSKGDLIRKVYFPRIILVISSTFTALLTFVLNMFAVFVFAIINGVNFNFGVLFILLYIFELYLFILGVGLALSSIFVKFRDLGHIWEVLNQILFYATPIIYPLSLVPIKYAKFQMLSPLAQVISDMRIILIGEGATLTTNDFWCFSWLPMIIVLITFIIGYIIFNKMSNSFAEDV